MESFQRVVLILVQSDFIDPEDRAVVKNVAYKLALDLNTFEEVNEKIKGQIKIEADMLYLLGVYRDKLTELKFQLEEEKASVFLETPKRNEEGFKTGVNELKAYQVINPEVAVKRRRLAAAESFYESLQHLNRIVFARNEKLKELSINYRREMKADEN